MYVRLKFSLSPRIIFKLPWNTQFQCSMLLFRASNHTSSSIKLTITKWRFLCPLTFLFSKMGGREIFTDTLVNINTWQEKKSMGFQRAMYTPWEESMWQPLNNWCSSCLASSPWLVESWKHQTCWKLDTCILSFWWKGWNSGSWDTVAASKLTKTNKNQGHPPEPKKWTTPKLEGPVLFGEMFEEKIP